MIRVYPFIYCNISGHGLSSILLRYHFLVRCKGLLPLLRMWARLHSSARVAPDATVRPRERKRKTVSQLFPVEVGGALGLATSFEVSVGTAAIVGVGTAASFGTGVGEGAGTDVGEGADVGVGEGAGEGVGVGMGVDVGVGAAGTAATDPASVA